MNISIKSRISILLAVLRFLHALLLHYESKLLNKLILALVASRSSTVLLLNGKTVNKRAFIIFGSDLFNMCILKFKVQITQFDGEIVEGYLFDKSKEQCEKRLLRWIKHSYICLYGLDRIFVIKTDNVVHVKVID